jgi:hypothetical protein
VGDAVIHRVPPPLLWNARRGELELGVFDVVSARRHAFFQLLGVLTVMRASRLPDDMRCNVHSNSGFDAGAGSGLAGFMRTNSQVVLSHHLKLL